MNYKNHRRCLLCRGELPADVKPKGTATAACGCVFNVCCEVTAAKAQKRADRAARNHEKKDCPHVAACA